MMGLVCVRASDMPAKTQLSLKTLCMAAMQAGGEVALKTMIVAFDIPGNALIIAPRCGRGNVVRYQFEDPKPQYRWN